MEAGTVVSTAILNGCHVEVLAPTGEQWESGVVAELHITMKDGDTAQLHCVDEECNGVLSLDYVGGSWDDYIKDGLHDCILDYMYMITEEVDDGEEA